jgi:hypothetical protein
MPEIDPNDINSVPTAQKIYCSSIKKDQPVNAVLGKFHCLF